ncbi:MAG TPA: ATP-binding cassette domain-containing protein, partial [Petrotogaceae bacterium]|nr:ATP-binding cassette domain-containing protein [Petrotogaceae bacterium]
MEPVIKCSSILKKYGRKTVLNHVDFTAEEGRITGILGPNGAGKTTLFKTVLGLVVPNKGKVFLKDKDITHLPIFQRALLGMGYLPQEPSVFRNVTVKDNLYMIADILKIKSKDEKIRKISKDFGIDSLLLQNADSLS